ncbi:hypothetical protein [Rhizobium sp. 10PS4]|uniref:hypothetical protein n=1 Tax=Rhizobium sp. 10PS4 TaxID=3075621 RepID=UPI0028FD5CFC|nr:hypothetical protein [Rhizobium sp. 10PS4]MDU0309428.1 hypothetical protein [Rhizobium sp. 10PS4]
MPDNDEVARIETAFARQYDLDLLGIRQDAASLREAVAGPINNNGAATFYTYNGTQAFIPDLETIDPSQVVPDPRLSIRHIEANLDDAAKYSQACLQLRLQYGELARHRNDTRFKGEEFVRLDAVHLHEVDEGLYKLPWKEAADEVEGLELALTQATIQQNIPEVMTGDVANGQKFAKLLSDQMMSDQITQNAFITRSVANTEKDKVETLANSTATYRANMEYATWQETLAAAKATVAQLSTKLKVARRKEDYLRKDEGFKLQRAFISRQLAWLQISEHCRSGSELNYDERLRATKSLFDENLRPLIERATVVNDGLKQVYGIDLPLGDLAKGGILDQISAWLVKASDTIATWKRTQRLTIVQIAEKIMIASDRKTFDATFTVNDLNLPNSNALLRGMNIEFIGDGKAPISVSVTPPAGVVLAGNAAPLRLGRVCPVAPNLELRPQQADLLWNGSPKGDWKVLGSLTSSSGSVDQIIMYLWVVSA